MKVDITIRLPRRLQQALARLETQVRTELAELAATIAVAEAMKNFERGGYETPTGTFVKWQPLSPLTLKLSEGMAKKKVGNGRIRVGRPTKAIGSGGTQKTAVVRRTGQSIPLVNTGRLRASLMGGAGHIRRSGAFGIEIGTNLPYAAVHQYGATIRVTPRMRGYLYAVSGVWVAASELHIPARPFLVVGRTALTRIQAAVEAYLQERLQGDDTDTP